MSTDAEVWLGELARSLARLRPRDHGTAAAMARMLGFQTNESEDESGDRGSTEPRRSPSASPTSPAGDSDSDADESTEAQLAELPLLERGPPRPERRPLPWTTADPLPEVSERHLHERLPPEPLLEPRWGRELLLAAIAAEVADSSIDETAVVDMIARGEPLEVLPRLKRWSLVRGVQLLVDDGAGMEPFRRDAREVARAVRALVGPVTVEELHFDASLALGVRETVLTPARPYAPPEPRTPVLVVGDLGMSPVDNASREEEWLELARRLAQRGSSMTALVPYGQQRWSARLARAMVLIQWDRSTTVRAVSALRRTGRVTAR